MKLQIELDLSHPANETREQAAKGLEVLLRGLLESIPQNARLGSSLQRTLEKSGQRDLVLAEMAEPQPGPSYPSIEETRLIGRIKYISAPFTSTTEADGQPHRQEFRNMAGERVDTTEIEV